VGGGCAAAGAVVSVVFGPLVVRAVRVVVYRAAVRGVSGVFAEMVASWARREAMALMVMGWLDSLGVRGAG
jgi:hypothetical protein